MGQYGSVLAVSWFCFIPFQSFWVEETWQPTGSPDMPGVLSLSFQGADFPFVPFLVSHLLASQTTIYQHFLSIKNFCFMLKQRIVNRTMVISHHVLEQPVSK